MTKQTKKQFIGFRFDPSLITYLRDKAAKTGQSMTSIVETALDPGNNTTTNKRKA